MTARSWRNTSIVLSVALALTVAGAAYGYHVAKFWLEVDLAPPSEPLHTEMEWAFTERENALLRAVIVNVGISRPQLTAALRKADIAVTQRRGRVYADPLVFEFDSNQKVSDIRQPSPQADESAETEDGPAAVPHRP